MDWKGIFHSLVIPFLGGLTVTIAKLIADHKQMSFNEANDVALDMVLLGVGALGAFYIKGGTLETVVDAGVGDAFLGVVLLYLRYQRRRVALSGATVPPIGPLKGIMQLSLGAGAILWTIKAF